MVNPHASGEERVGAGNGEGDGSRQLILELHRRHEFLAEGLVDEVVSRLDQLRRCESPLVAAADQERVFRCGLDLAVDDDVPNVLSQEDARHTGRDPR